MWFKLKIRKERGKRKCSFSLDLCKVERDVGRGCPSFTLIFLNNFVRRDDPYIWKLT